MLAIVPDVDREAGDEELLLTSRILSNSRECRPPHEALFIGYSRSDSHLVEMGRVDFKNRTAQPRIFDFNSAR
jgi:hypothetical protein